LGSHICQFYPEKEDLLQLLVPYFKQGLEKNDACVWLVGDLTVEEARSALSAAVPDIDYYLAKGQITIRHYSELYTNPDGTVKAAGPLCEQFAAMEPTVREIGRTVEREGLSSSKGGRSFHASGIGPSTNLGMKIRFRMSAILARVALFKGLERITSARFSAIGASLQRRTSCRISSSSAPPFWIRLV
jgi:hypothetical protein